jgi:glycosyltransferase involved in cell wall biosynthesis
MKHKHKILYIHEEAEEIGGGGVSIYNLVANLDRSRFDPIIMCPENWKLKNDLERLNIQFVRHFLPSWTKGKNIPFIIPSVLRLIRLIKREGICLIFHCGFMTNPYSFLATRIISIPTVCRLFGYDAEKKWHMTAYFVRYATSYVLPSHYCAPLLEKVGLDKKKMNVIHIGLKKDEYVNEISKIQARELLNISRESPVIGQISRIVPNKGLEYLIQAVGSLKNTFPDVKCYIVGEISKSIKDPRTLSYYHHLESLIEQLNLKNNVFFTGFVDNKTKKHYLVAFDIFILASVFEDYGMVLLEAMASGRPVVASHTGGIPEIVEHGVTGILVPPAEALALARGVSKLLNSPEGIVRMGIEGRKRFESQFTIEKEVSEHQKFYESLLTCDQK